MYDIPYVFKILTNLSMRTYVDAEGKTYRYSVPPLFAFITTLFIGILTGLFGIGGALMTPLMLIVFRFPPCCSRHKYDDDFLFKCDEFDRAYPSRTCGLGIFYHSHYFKCDRCKIGVRVNRSMKSDTVVMLRTVMLIMGYI